MKIAIVNGPNLNFLGKREPEIYGDKTFEDYLKKLRSNYSDEIEYFQSNSEGALIDKIQQLSSTVDGIILNAGAYTHTSLALADCIKSIDTKVVEVHISNTAARESIRHHSYIATVCVGTITGFGMHSYRLAIEALTLSK